MFSRILHASASLSQFRNRKWPDSLPRWTVSSRAPEYHVTDTNYDTMFCAYRPAEKGQTYWTFAISSFRSGRRRRRAPLTGSTAAPGSRWTTPTRCSSA
jgi:hypothetical protein